MDGKKLKDSNESEDLEQCGKESEIVRSEESESSSDEEDSDENKESEARLRNFIEREELIIKDLEFGGSSVEDSSVASCPICLKRFGGQALGSPENCNHTFCFECIMEWTKNFNICPIDKVKYHRVGLKHEVDGIIIKKTSDRQKVKKRSKPERKMEKSPPEILTMARTDTSTSKRRYPGRDATQVVKIIERKMTPRQKFHTRKPSQRSLLSTSPLAGPTIKKRMTDRLGLCKPPTDPSNSGPKSSLTKAQGKQFSLSICGDKDRVIDFSECAIRPTTSKANVLGKDGSFQCEKTKVHAPSKGELLKESVAAEVNQILKPYYMKNIISKDDYKEIMRRTVPKVFINCDNNPNYKKIKKLVLEYIELFKKSSH